MAATISAVALAVGATGCAGSNSSSTSTRPRLSFESLRAQQIALARASNPRVFSIFPAKPGKQRCSIPEGGVHRRPGVLEGWCTTSIHRSDSHGPALVVTFTEKWWPCPNGAYCFFMPRLPHHTWRVIVRETSATSSSGLRVVATHQRGTAAPQYYK